MCAKAPICPVEPGHGRRIVSALIFVALQLGVAGGVGVSTMQTELLPGFAATSMDFGIIFPELSVGNAIPLISINVLDPIVAKFPVTVPLGNVVPAGRNICPIVLPVASVPNITMSPPVPMKTPVLVAPAILINSTSRVSQLLVSGRLLISPVYMALKLKTPALVRITGLEEPTAFRAPTGGVPSGVPGPVH